MKIVTLVKMVDNPINVSSFLKPMSKSSKIVSEIQDIENLCNLMQT